MPVPALRSEHNDQESDNDIPEEHDDRVECDPDFVEESTPVKFTQGELNDLVRDLGLSKEAAELLASRLNEKHLLTTESNVTFYRNRDTEFAPFFAESDDFVYCTDAKNVVLTLGLPLYNPIEWRLFLDSSKRSLKAVLLNNTNVYAPIPIGHSTVLKEQYDAIKLVLERIQYSEHQWLICVDLKMVNFLLGQQGGYTKHPCFLCMWDSRAKVEHYIRRDWGGRELKVGEKNVINEALVPRDKIIFPPLHIKLGLIKQFVKALDKNGDCFKYICNAFPGLSDEKLKAGVFNGPDIRKLVKDPDFVNSMNDVEKRTWCAFVAVVKNFLGNNRAANYSDLVEELLNCFHEIGANMSIKVHYLHSHLNNFPDNCGDYSDEQGERFHQDLKVMEDRYQGRWDKRMMSDYCWSIKQDVDNAPHQRKSRKRTFKP